MELTLAERAIIDELGFDQNLFAQARWLTPAPFERLQATSDKYRPEPGPGLSVAVKNGDQAERVRDALLPLLGPQGYRVWWSSRRAANGMHLGDELAILKTADPYAILRLRRTDGGNYGISTDDIVDRLRAWEELCAFDVVGAAGDWVALVFSRLPEKLCAFAEEIYAFCPDTVTQGVGLNRESEHRSLFEAARRLCPEVHVECEEETFDDDVLPPQARQFMAGIKADSGDLKEESEMGVRLLAHALKEKRYLFLWWD